MDILEKLEGAINEAMGSLGTVAGFRVGDRVSYAGKQVKIADKDKTGTKASKGFYDKDTDSYLVNLPDGSSKYVPAMELMKESENSYPSKEEMIDYLLNSGALFHNEEGTKAQFETLNDEELKEYYKDTKSSE